MSTPIFEDACAYAEHVDYLTEDSIIVYEGIESDADYPMKSTLAIDLIHAITSLARAVPMNFMGNFHFQVIALDNPDELQGIIAYYNKED